MSDDPFATDEVRERVLTGWAAAPVRFREDANAEEDFALGGYRDRLIVELAQNAADAAQRAGVQGRLLLALREWEGRAVLVAANTGAPLTADGVQALATLRASDKRDEDVVGRFGVGFSAVLAVTDEPAVLSRTGGVRFSAADTRDLVSRSAAHAPSLADEVARRDGHVPVLRLPFRTEGSPPTGYDTAVLLPLRDAVAEEVVLRLLGEVGDPLLLALPALVEVLIELPGAQPCRVADVDRRWHVLRRGGHLDPQLLADRPTEERRRTAWSVAWALPRDGEQPEALPGVLHAPTRTDEPLDWPALLLASFPLDSTRRHVAPGPATDALVEFAGQAYADLLAERAAAGTAIWPLVPVGLARGVIDGALREVLRRLLPGTPMLIPAEQRSEDRSGALLRPRDAVVLEPPAGADRAVVAGLAPTIDGLVLAPRSAGPALDLLGVRRIGLTDVVEQLPAQHGPADWHRIYAALDGLANDPLAREALASLPVPLADGRLVRGVRGLALPAAGDATAPELSAALSRLGVRLVDPVAAHPLLERLGATPLEPRAALELPAVRAAVQASNEEDDPELVDAVLMLVASAVADGGLAPGDLPWLADLVLVDADDDVAPAGELALPGSFAEQVMDPDDIVTVSSDLVERWGGDTLAAVGVLQGLTLLRLPEVALSGPDADDDRAHGPAADDLDGWQDWADDAAGRAEALFGEGSEVVLAELVAVRDLDAVRDGAWPQVLAKIGGDPELRAALLRPARLVVRGVRGASTVDVRPYSAWWLERALAGGPWADPDAEPALANLLPPPPDGLGGLDAALRRALGAVRSASELDAAAVEAVLAGMADPDVEMDAAGAVTLWRELAGLAGGALAEGPGVAPPAWVRVLDGPGTRVVKVGEAVVVDGPAWLQRSDLGAAVVAPDPGAAAALADLLDVPLAGDLAMGKVEESGQVVSVPAGVLTLLPGAPATWCEHEELLVDGVDVDWWVEGHGRDARVHASTFDGLARGLAWAAGRWSRRGAVAEVLTDPGAIGSIMVDEAFG
jgi:hypothetical protein